MLLLFIHFMNLNLNHCPLYFILPSLGVLSFSLFSKIADFFLSFFIFSEHSSALALLRSNDENCSEVVGDVEK